MIEVSKHAIQRYFQRMPLLGETPEEFFTRQIREYGRRVKVPGNCWRYYCPRCVLVVRHIPTRDDHQRKRIVTVMWRKY